MYNPVQFQESDTEVIHGLIRDFPFASLVTLAGGAIDANHLPLFLDSSQGEFGVLRGHISKANPLFTDPHDSLEALAIFRGPDAYITPSWYPTKHETGRVVPTWNYVVAHAHGKLRFHSADAWIRQHLQEMTDLHEQGRVSPWSIADAPGDYIGHLANMVVGVEITIDRLESKWKLSQNQPARNRQGVVGGLRHENETCPMASLVEAAHRNSP